MRLFLSNSFLHGFFPKTKDHSLSSLSIYSVLVAESSSAGSAQSKSHISPSKGGSLNLSNLLICSIFFSSGEIPPCIAKYFLPANQERGRASNASIIKSYTSWSNFLIVSSLNVKWSVMFLHSWFPLKSTNDSG